jgi:hypothetical protein
MEGPVRDQGAGGQGGFRTGGDVGEEERDDEGRVLLHRRGRGWPPGYLGKIEISILQELAVIAMERGPPFPPDNCAVIELLLRCNNILIRIPA